MNNNGVKENDSLVKYGSWSGWEFGSFTSYEILKNGIINLTVNIAGTAVTLTDTLSKEEMDKIYKFLNESTGEYESADTMDAGSFIIINGKEYDNCDELNSNFNDVLDEVLENHFVFSQESVSHVYDILETNKDIKVSNMTGVNINKMIDDNNTSNEKVDEVVNTLHK